MYLLKEVLKRIILKKDFGFESAKIHPLPEYLGVLVVAFTFNTVVKAKICLCFYISSVQNCSWKCKLHFQEMFLAS